MKAIDVSMKVLELVTEYTKNPKMPLQQVIMLLQVINRGEATMDELMKAAGIAQSAVSRNVALLGPGVNPKEPGYRLIEAAEDPYYRRRKLVTLTPLGQALKADLEKLKGLQS